jgi:hypothetical protein
MQIEQHIQIFYCSFRYVINNICGPTHPKIIQIEDINVKIDDEDRIMSLDNQKVTNRRSG